MASEGDHLYDDFGDPAGNVPFEIDFVTALGRAMPSLSELQQNLLAALLDASDNELSGGQIARLLGLSHHAGINSAMVALGKALTKAVGVEPPRRSHDGTERWWHVAVTGRRSADRRRFLWRLRPELRDAAIRVGFSAPRLAEAQETGDEPLVEGAVRTVRVNAYERNPVARRRCIEHHGASCAVCGLALATVYGPIADGVIHVHHLRPLSACGGEDYQVDPITELRPVCPNCHVVLHLRQPPYTIEELRDLVEAKRLHDAKNG